MANEQKRVNIGLDIEHYKLLEQVAKDLGFKKPGTCASVLLVEKLKEVAKTKGAVDGTK
jgi:hypothetical protein